MGISAACGLRAVLCSYTGGQHCACSWRSTSNQAGQEPNGGFGNLHDNSAWLHGEVEPQATLTEPAPPPVGLVSPWPCFRLVKLCNLIKFTCQKYTGQHSCPVGPLKKKKYICAFVSKVRSTSTHYGSGSYYPTTNIPDLNLKSIERPFEKLKSTPAEFISIFYWRTTSSW